MATSETTGEAVRASSGAALEKAAERARALHAAGRARLGEWGAAETGRLALWAPAAIGAGAGIYFSLKFEPPLWASLAVLFATVSIWSRSGAHKRAIVGAALFIALGFVAADLRTARVAAPAIERELFPREISGRLVSVEESARARRLIIEVSSIDRFDGALPERVRVTWRGEGFDVLPGEVIRLRAGLSPPPPPAAPGAFDFARYLFFQRIGAVGYAVTAPEQIETARQGIGDRIAADIERVRLSMARRILEKAPGEGGAIVAAVVTGKRGAVSEASEAALRDSGLAHLLAISGLHMGLATGLIFFAVRFGLSLAEPLALRFPIKKWAAAAALLAGFTYLLLSGGGWSARRAFIMTTIVFIAIVFDRRGLSLRNVAVAATIILLTTPEAILHPGFQMSFAAVTALIAAYEWASTRADPDRSFSLAARARRYIVGVGVTDTVAATATAPYSLFHFHRVALYSLAGNVAAVPVMGLWVMPMAIAALFLVPFGGDGWAWRASAAGVEAILSIGGAVSGQSGAVATIAQMPPAALVAITVGGLWLCLQRHVWRFAGLAAIPFAFVIAMARPAPDIFISEEGDNAGIVVEAAGGAPALAIYHPRKDRFAAGVWKEYAGLDKVRAPSLAMEEIGACDPAGCVVRVKDAVVAVSEDPLGLADDCRRADLVIALYPVRGGAFGKCEAKLVDRVGAWRRGAHAVWIGKGGKMRVRNVAEMRGVRPWVRE